ncbi:putative membrane associated, exported and processed into extracellular protein EXP [Burkholderia thailandensis MSMB121]|uniref:hypothetical protein n=1 Tax=Burkholderia TaxID=32008 RepID=UPI000327F63A|nr:MULTISPECIES: hypothetical protein [Burkholderia]AGK48793.1 putative membrane associated, exported and processed into extracellular protein EXP [Burkholderia thailandensis MSMB121]ATF36941.1 hypothetical protein CO709_29310 [Burkholderia thailandensis]KST74313.1 hypothetical protein WS76_09215 [Burkholderia humptydooensis]
MHTSFPKLLSFAVMASAAILLAACGGGGSSPSATIQGKVVDFYLSGATVTFLDCGNQTTTTSTTGDFTFPANCARSALSATGGTDIGTNLPFTGVLQAPAQNNIAGVTPMVTPLSTLVAQVGAAQATSLAFKLGLPGKDLLNTDPMKDGAVLKAALVVQQVVDQISKTLIGVANSAGGTLSTDVATAAAANAVANVINNGSGVVSLNTGTVSSAIQAAVINVQSSLPTSLQSNIGNVAINAAALGAPTVTKLASNVSTGLGTINLGTDPASTVAALQKSGALNGIFDSSESTLTTTLVSAITPVALGNASLTANLTTLGNAVATGTAQTITNAANALGSAVNSTTLNQVVNLVTLTNYIQLGNVTLNNGVPVPLSPSLSVSGGSLTDVQVALTKQGSPFGTGASEVRAGMSYTFNGNTVNVIIERVVLTFNGSSLIAAIVPVGTKYAFSINGAVNASASLSTSIADNLFSTAGGGSLDLPIVIFLNKLQGAGGLTAGQIDALTPKATSTVNTTLSVSGTSGTAVKVGTGSGSNAAETATTSVSTGTDQVSGDGVTVAITVNP